MKSKKKKKIVNKSSGLLTSNSVFKENILYFTLVLVAYLYFLFSFFSLPDFTNPHIINNSSWIVNLEIAIDTILFFVVAYCGYCYINGKENFSNKFIVLFVFLCIFVIHLLALNTAIDIGGDNGTYIYMAKSIATKGNTYQLPTPGFPPTSVAFGFPLFLSFIYLIFGGINILAFKIFTMLLSLLSVFIFYRIMLKLNSEYFAIALTILYGIHCSVLNFSSMIMTETPTLFWSVFTWYSLLRFCEKETFNWKIFIGLVFTSTFTYLTRQIGISVIGAVIIYLFFYSDFKYKGRKSSFDYLKIKKLIYYFIFVFVILLLIQLRSHYFAGMSDSATFFSSSIADKIDKFLVVWKVYFGVLSENLFPNNIIRGQVSHLFVNILIQLVFYYGLVVCLLKKNFASFYYAIFVLLLSIATPDIYFMPISRYLVPLTPFFVYIFYFGIFNLFKLLGRTSKILSIIIIFFHLIFLFHGNAYLIQKSHTGEEYPLPIANYYNCAKWINKNLSHDVIVESRKGTVFYIFAECFCTTSVFSDYVYTEDLERHFIKKIENNEMDYLVLDGFSGASWRCYYPFIQKFPQHFQLVKVFGEKYPTYLFKVIN